jgi:hypothetical protein
MILKQDDQLCARLLQITHGVKLAIAPASVKGSLFPDYMGEMETSMSLRGYIFEDPSLDRRVSSQNTSTDSLARANAW